MTDGGYSKWLKQFDGQATVALNMSNKNIERLANILFEKIVDYTPVGNPSLWSYPAPKDYNPGSLKAAWTLDFSEWNIRTGGVIKISNNLPYALRVENGYSSQAPSGMMRRAILDLK